ncbi:hypothetical protein ACLI09_13000 [Flavobacterium sp. RHBU_24]|uniref:hypothetical protein n=1 Tax=Flavobacterium sp. RHBU_24 TaxID=3391185 RepID=UPI003984E1DF
MKWTVILTILIGVFQLIAIIMPLTGTLSDRRRRPYYKILTWRGYTIVVSSFFALLCTIAIFIITDSESNSNDAALKKQLKIRDNEHAKAIKQAGMEYIDRLGANQRETAEALAKYGLKYDKTKEEIIKIAKSDTLRQHLAPYIDLADDGIKLDSINKTNTISYFKFRMKNTISPAKNTLLNLYILEGANNLIRFKKDAFVMLSGNDFAFDSIMESNIYEIPIREDADKVFFYFYGTYMDMSNKHYELKRVYYFDLKTKSYGLPSTFDFLNIKEILIKNGLY